MRASFWKLGRVVDCTGLENRQPARAPGFESLSFRQRTATPMLPRALRATILLLASCAVFACGGSDDTPADNYRVTIESLPLVMAPRVAAAHDGSTWIAWTESATAGETVFAASVDPSGRLIRSRVSVPVDSVVRDVQIVMAGSTPVAAWRDHASNGSAVHFASHVSGTWGTDLVTRAPIAGDLQMIPLKDGRASAVWQQTSVTGESELMSAQKSARGEWSVPALVAVAPAGTVMGAPRHAASADGSLSVLWTEAPVQSGAPVAPQTLMSARHGATTGYWEAAQAVDGGDSLHAAYDIVSAGPDGWLAVWFEGSPSGYPALQSKRLTAGAWDTTPTRVDTGEDHTLRELAWVPTGSSSITLIWTGLSDAIAPSSIRSARFDVSQGAWSAPALIARYDSGYPVLPRLASGGNGSAAAVWNVSQGSIDSPVLASTAAADPWRSPSLLDRDRSGLAADLALFSADDLVTTWYRIGPQGRSDIVVDRRRLSGSQ